MRNWSKEKAWKWYQELPWLCGFNYIPRTAVNWTEMWQEDTFDLATIKQEIAWAKAIGFNTVRTNIPFIVWQHDREQLWQRLNRFLEVTKENGFFAMLCLLDDCEFSGEYPYLGSQKPPIPQVHNSQASASPGRNLVMQKEKWLQVEAYIKDALSTFGEDKRVFVWDLYNEPGNGMIFDSNDQERDFHPAFEDYSYELMVNVFSWAREMKTMQPLTVAGWHVPMHWVKDDENVHDHFIDLKAFELSDIITFHAYSPTERLRRIIRNLERYDRPMLCTEWMARQAGSRILEQLPIFHRENIGCYQWGLVRGKTQTYLPWPGIVDHLPDHSDALDEWFHDLLYPDGTPYSEEEVALIKKLSET